MKKYLLSLAVMAMGTSLLTSCLGDDSNNNTPVDVLVTKGVLVINSGSYYQGIDGSLTYLDYSTATPTAQQNVYQKVNGASLGGTPNDVMSYGQKIYIVGSDENMIFVLDARTFKEIKKVSTTELLGEAEGTAPRHIVAFGDKVYFTTYGTSGKGYVAAIDTISFDLKAKIQVGSYPEGLAFGISSSSSTSPAKLYVANSDYGNGGGDISIIDMTSQTVSTFKNEKIKNPQKIAVAGDLLYVLDFGYYEYGEDITQKDAGVYMINGNDVSLVVPNATGMAGAGVYIYTFNNPFGGTGPTFSVYNISTNNTSTLYLTGDSSHKLVSPCAINIDMNTGNLYIASCQLDPDTGYPSYAIPGFINVYTSNGEFVESFQTGIDPHEIDFYYGKVKVQY